MKEITISFKLKLVCIRNMMKSDKIIHSEFGIVEQPVHEHIGVME